MGAAGDTKVDAAGYDAHVEIAEELDEEIQALIGTDHQQGLSDAQVAERLLRFGPNQMPEKRTSPILKFLSFFGGAISILLEVAVILTAVIRDWIDFGILLFVLVINAVIGYLEEAKAESALDALKGTLALKCRTWRNGQLVEVESSGLVPGDIVVLRLGDIVPADALLLGVGATGEETGGELQIDQSALTGESLPVNKHKGQTAYSSSIVKQGQMLAVVTKTGANTYIGRAANLISMTEDQGHFQKIINHIGNFLIAVTVAMVLILLLVNVAVKRVEFLTALKQVVILTVAAIPVGLPTVMSVTMAVGASQLAKKQVIVKRLTAIEELASVSVLCSDKTGTLTLNQLTFDAPYLCHVGNTGDHPIGDAGIPYTEQDLLLHAYFASEPGAGDPIEKAVRGAAQARVALLSGVRDHNIPGYKVNQFVPFNPNVKYTEARVTNLATGQSFRAIKGAPQVIIQMVGGHPEATAQVLDFAHRGLRALGVARSVDAEMTRFELVGMISLIDPPRPDSAQTIRECEDLGVKVKMITGDQLVIGKTVAQRLGMQRTILDASLLVDDRLDVAMLTERVEKADGFAQVIPEHKYRVVELLQNKGYLVGMTGDGVNDAPALKRSNVGIAVEGCTEAARSAADIVLLASGLSTIVDGIKTSRAIFQRMRSYALYRIASTIHFLLFFFITLLVWDFALPDRLIIMIAVLNDAATMVISVDNVTISRRPDKWRLGQLITLSFILGLGLMVLSFLHFFVVRYAFGHLDAGEARGFLHTVMYLQISSAPHFLIFATRCESYLWTSRPSWTFIVAIGATQIIAMFMSIYGVDFFEAYPIGWGWGLSIMGTSLLSMFLLDALKVQVLRRWSFELTAHLWPVAHRRDELRRRQARAKLLKRVNCNIDAMRRVYLICLVSGAFKAGLQDRTSKPRVGKRLG
ncbi:hypothetical protein CXG81DRAFT_10900 [Caulochytrium protostelioides]|uniref:Plasma membrane ATPase n=1 Tax=Caulochytrium protostelioides TaxID=1555241 RepID=A0A4P9XB55_9FUNG|nr:hypothetical protein CXG81DRAFT_10900 [Caulochytrium protostelioides]|eukprot:RKP02331.1 hypothetical protein CXG81DRAFT_10900 [Caulochytrium protostelioides]